MTSKKKPSLTEQPTEQLSKEMLANRIWPDGVLIEINWDDFKIGTSIFIPAINLVGLDKQMQKLATARNMRIQGFQRIENKKLGMRFWRIL